jgi:CRP-like cAMP-binding protein
MPPNWLAPAAVGSGAAEPFFDRRGERKHGLPGRPALCREPGKCSVPLYGDREYPATASVVTESDAMSSDRSGTDRLMERHPRLAIHALEILGEELAETRRGIKSWSPSGWNNVWRGRLRSWSAGRARGSRRALLIAFPLSRQDLAELTRTMLHTVSRILSRWEEAGIVKSGRQRVIIRKPQGLFASWRTWRRKKEYEMVLPPARPLRRSR